MSCSVVILQPSYIPWRGYFHQIQKADVFVFYDDVQYDARGWRNRNRIKTPAGTQWLTVPVHHKGHQAESTPINAIDICWDAPWNSKHWRTIERCYAKAPCFNKYATDIEQIFSRRPQRLVDLTIPSTIELATLLGIRGTEFRRSSELNASGQKSDRLLSILTTLGATHYISGPSAQDYLELDKFDDAGISVEFMEYNYPEYPQLYPPFESTVSVLDLLFMTGSEAGNYIWPSFARQH